MRIPLVGVKAINGHSFVLYENILEKKGPKINQYASRTAF